jgi:MoxR-like ATPase
MNITNLKELLKYSYISEIPVLINGKHGIGKSSVVKQFGHENNLHVEVLNLSLMEPADLLGMPDSDKELNRTIWLEPEWFQEIIDKAWPINFYFDDLEFTDKDFEKYIIENLDVSQTIKRKELNSLYCSYYNISSKKLELVKNQNFVSCKKSINSILFLDELNRANSDVRQPALQLTLDKKLQCHELPYIKGKRTFIVAAINPADLYQTDELDMALLDRFLLVNLEVDVNDWLKYGANTQINECILSYIAEKPENLHYISEDITLKGASPRSWEELSELLKNDIRNSIVLEGIIKGKVGSYIGTEFYVYYKKFKDLFKIDDLVKTVFDNAKKDVSEISNILKEQTKNIDTIRKQALLNHLLILASTELESKNYNIISLSLISFLNSLNFEISIMFIKKLKNSDYDLYNNLVILDEKINAKKFFNALVQYS